MKVICKKIVPFKFIKCKKNYWTKGKTYLAFETGYNKFSVKDNSGIIRDFTQNDLERYFDIIH